MAFPRSLLKVLYFTLLANFLCFAPCEPTVIDTALGEQDMTIYYEHWHDDTAYMSDLRVVDLNRDGMNDLVLGCSHAGGPSDSRPRSGEVYIIFGPISGTDLDLATGNVDVIMYGADTDDDFGFSIAVAELSGDGILDIAVGAKKAEGPNLDRFGVVYVFFGPFTSGTVIDVSVDAADAMIVGRRPPVTDLLGYSLAAGDMT
ncbi:integrin alpha, partial [Acidobacteriota bacterium]